MDEVRKGQIALMVLKHVMRRSGLHLSQHTLREVGSAAKEMGIPVEELKQFAKPLIQEFLNECLEKQPENQGEAK